MTRGDVTSGSVSAAYRASTCTTNTRVKRAKPIDRQARINSANR